MKKLLLIAILFSSVSFCCAQSWVPVGSGTNSWVGGFAEYGNKLYVGGIFTIAGGKSIDNIATWDGANWDTVGSGIKAYSGGGCSGVYAYDSVLYSYGQFYKAGSCRAGNIAQWNGVKWDSLGPGDTNTGDDVVVATNYKGKVYAGGGLTITGTKISNIARWNGMEWDSVGTGINNTPWTMAVYNGKLYVGGYFTQAGGVKANYIASWDGTKWDSVGSGMDYLVFSLCTYNGKLYAGGSFTTAGGVSANSIAVWNDTTWSALGSGITGGAGISVMSIYGYGSNLYAGGTFTTAGGSPANNIAKWDGKNWSALGAGLTGDNPDVWTLYVYDSLLYAGGWFDSSGSTPVSYIARWTDTLTGIKEVQAKRMNVQVYPNPSSGIFTVQMQGVNQKSEIEVYNMLGEKIYDASINSTITQINLSSQPTGIYLYRITDTEGNTISAGKFVI